MASSDFEEYRERIKLQLKIVGKALGEPDCRDGEHFPGIAIACTEVDGYPRYVFQNCGIMVPDEYETVARNRVGARLDLRQVNHDERRRDGGYQLLNVPLELGAVKAVEALREACGNHRAGTLNHIMSITPTDGGANLCPAAEPTPATAPESVPESEFAWPPPTQHESGHRVRVRVIDTGLVPDAALLARWMEGVEGPPRLRPDESGVAPALAELESADVAGRNLVDGAPPLPSQQPDYNVYYGHGTFIAGVIRCVAPDADVWVANDFRQAGALTELRLIEALQKLLDSPEPMPDIISLSAGGYFRSGCHLPALAEVLSALRDRQRRDGRPVLVAAAGNDGRNEAFWPAAFHGVYSVGALRERDLARACFSNYGDWVSLYAPGERLVNVFPAGTYAYYHGRVRECRYFEPPDARYYQHCTCVQPHDNEKATFTGRARWSGTSFATPIVAGLIAQRMSRTGENARDAAAWVRSHPTGSIEGLGDYVLPPGYTGNPD